MTPSPNPQVEAEAREALEKIKRNYGLLGGWSPSPVPLLETLHAFIESSFREAPLSLSGIDYQARVGEWMIACFGSDITNSLAERCFRFFEEAGELCQALDMTEDMAHQLVAYTWGREKGLASQEVGGVMVTLAALCFAANLDMAEDGETELTRISAPEVMDKIRRKHAAKVLRTPHDAIPGQIDATPKGS